MEPIITVLNSDLVDISVKLADDGCLCQRNCIFGFTLDRTELHKFITALRDAAFQMDD